MHAEIPREPKIRSLLVGDSHSQKVRPHQLRCAYGPNQEYKKASGDDQERSQPKRDATPRRAPSRSRRIGCSSRRIAVDDYAYTEYRHKDPSEALCEY